MTIYQASSYFNVTFDLKHCSWCNAGMLRMSNPTLSNLPQGKTPLCLKSGRIHQTIPHTPRLHNCTSQTGNFPRPLPPSSRYQKEILKGELSHRTSRDSSCAHTLPAPSKSRRSAANRCRLRSVPARAVLMPPRTRPRTAECGWGCRPGPPVPRAASRPPGSRALAAAHLHRRPRCSRRSLAGSGTGLANLTARPARHRRPRLPPRRRRRTRRPHDNAAHPVRPPGPASSAEIRPRPRSRGVFLGAPAAFYYPLFPERKLIGC